ncbi:hypothetical protein [Mesorhizobium sp. M0306]|uniref:hypothetical protein n=1 Tax=unclassified Mesorhizobium TaxID=325217 RepID=UPI00333CD1FA
MLAERKPQQGRRSGLSKSLPAWHRQHPVEAEQRAKLMFDHRRVDEGQKSDVDLFVYVTYIVCET